MVQIDLIVLIFAGILLALAWFVLGVLIGWWTLESKNKYWRKQYLDLLNERNFREHVGEITLALDYYKRTFGKNWNDVREAVKLSRELAQLCEWYHNKKGTETGWYTITGRTRQSVSDSELARHRHNRLDVTG